MMSLTISNKLRKKKTLTQIRPRTKKQLCTDMSQIDKQGQGKHHEPLMIIVAHALMFDCVPLGGPSVTRRQVQLFNNRREKSCSIFFRFVGICRGIQIHPVQIVQVLTKQAVLLTAEHTAGLQANILLLMKKASYVYFVRAEIIKIIFCTLNQIKILANVKFDCFILVPVNIKMEVHINQVSRGIFLTQAYHVF